LANAYDEGPQNPEVEGPSSRRNYVPDLDMREVRFARRRLHPEQIEALRDFLAHASADEISVIRKLYGETPEILREIGLEM
jgi:hypothetical protein